MKPAVLPHVRRLEGVPQGFLEEEEFGLVVVIQRPVRSGKMDRTKTNLVASNDQCVVTFFPN